MIAGSGMAKVLTLAARKGGSGKSTIAASLAVAAAQDGEGVALVDLDPQRSLADWHNRRDPSDIARSPDDGATLSDQLARLRGRPGISLIVIDTAGDFTPAVTDALRASDLTLVPVKPSVMDVTATERTVEALAVLKRPFAFVLSQAVPSSTGRAEQAAMALMERGRLAPVPITHRVDYLDAITMGQGVTEYAPSGRAAVEVRELWTWVKAELVGK